MEKNYYEILNISKNATKEEIRKSYRKLALKYHPDKNKEQNAHNIFIEINIAYETLKNPNSRTDYDNFLKSRNNSYKTEFEDNFNQYESKNYHKKAKEYANMSYEQFENIIENIVFAGKKVKKTASMGCGWLLTIIFFSLAGITFIGAFVGGNLSIIFLSLVLAFFGYGSYAMAKGE